MFADLQSNRITQFHDTCLNQVAWPKDSTVQFGSGVWQAIEANHRFNCLLWAEEDLARRKHVADSEIAANKRAIDGYNQKRNDATENVDEHILALLLQTAPTPAGRLNSETAGSMIDRMSIMALKIFNMRKQTERTDVDADHIQTCQQKLAQLIEQRHDLAACFDQLLADAQAGVAHYKIYRQFKMYNDPRLNPQLYDAPKI